MKQVKELISGKIFTYAGEKFVVLGSKNGGVHVLRAQSRKDRCVFYEGDGMPCNHYGKSTLREHIEQDFLQKLIRNGANSEDWIPLDLDLSETDGSVGYGILEGVQAAPLTLREWGMYKDIIPNNEDGPFWLATPFWTPRSPSINNTNGVWSVHSGGLYNYWSYNDTCGVRPRMILNPSVLVSVDGENEEEKETDLTKVSNKILIEEFNRRLNKGLINLAVDLKEF